MTGNGASIRGIREYPNTIQQFVFVGDFGHDTYTGRFEFAVEEGIASIIIPIESDESPLSDIREERLRGHDGDYIVVVADGEVETGGKAIEIYEPDGEGQIHIVIDQYPMGN